MNRQCNATLFLAVVLGCTSSATSAAKYTGAWFQVWFPDDFKAIPSMASTTAEEGVDSAFFRSPDGQVEFYIFSPQWSGEPTDIAMNASLEIVRAKETTASGDKQITRLTIDAKDGSYSRSYRDTVSNNGSIRGVVGIKYKDQAAYNRYKSSYLRFKRSLQQFAD